jgi:hypothetical protein
MTSSIIESYEAELRAAGIDVKLLAMCAEGAIAHAKLVEAERDEARIACDEAERARDAARSLGLDAQKITDAALIKLGEVARERDDLRAQLEKLQTQLKSKENT